VFISSIWFFMVCRRENYTIATLLKDAWNSGDERTRWLVFHGINSYTVFTSAYRFDFPISKLTQRDLDDKVKPLGEIYARKFRKSRKLKVLAVRILYYLPVIALCLSLIMDVIVSTGLIVTSFRYPEAHILMPLALELLYWLLASSMLAVDIYLCGKIYRFAQSTEDVLADYRQRLINVHHRLTSILSVVEEDGDNDDVRADHFVCTYRLHRIGHDVQLLLPCFINVDADVPAN
jgi:hypothetical protein